MLSIYTSYRCRMCKNELILLTEELEMQLKNGRYIACPYCNSQRIIKQKTGDNLKELMGHDSYKRVKGALRQK